MNTRVKRNSLGIAPRFSRLMKVGLVLAAVMRTSIVFCTPPAAPGNLRVNDVENPVGTGAAPYFGWYVNDPDNDEIQTRFQILVASSKEELKANHGDAWDSGEVVSRRQNHVAFAGRPLESDHRYFWKLRTWDKDSTPGPWSEPASFVTGLLTNANWSGAYWIRRDSSDADDYTYYRKTVKLPNKTVNRATVYISGTHKYALYVNGTLVGKGPAYHYPQYQYYNAYDITSLISADSTNLFALFNHWFGGGQGRPVSARGVIMKAIIHYSDGSSTTIGTDGSWKQSRAESWVAGQPHRNKGEGVGYIEKIDARALEPDWNTLSFDDSSWDTASVVGAHPVSPWTGTLTPDLTRIEEHVITPVSITRQSGGKYLVDLGKVYAGMPRIRFSGGSSGDSVEMLGGYALDSDGNIDPSKNQSTDMSYSAILNGETFTYEPVEYLGMRYFAINNPPMPITTSNFSFIERHSQMSESRSSFDSPDATLNAVWALMKDSLLTCAQEEFVDTPTREKGGFLGDAAIQSTVAMPVMNERLLTQRVLNEFLQSMDQHWSSPADRGRMNAVYPNRDGARDIPDFTQAYLVWAWNYYMETGDLDFLSGNYAKFKDIANYVYRYQDGETGLVTNLEGGSSAYKYGIVDWPAKMRFDYDMVAARTVINGWAYADYCVIAGIAKELGKPDDCATYQARADALKNAMNALLLKRSGVYVDGLDSSRSKSAHVSQHANMFPLALGIVPDAQEKSVVDQVRKMRMSVGMVTLPWLIRALGEASEGEHLIELFTSEKWLGWAQCLSRGATSTWESWDADETGQSLSHAWGASGLEGYVHYIMGIQPIKPQYEKVRIKPLDFGTRLRWAKGTIATDRGDISVHWKRNANAYFLELNLPDNVVAEVVVPRGDADTPLIYLDGNAVEGTINGQYVVINHVGSGPHTIARFATVLSPKDAAQLTEFERE